MKKTTYILGIESSCDETAASILKVEGGDFEILSSVISSQVKVHAKFGGIVPEVAARLHIEKVLPIIESAIKEADLTMKQVDYLAVCSGPGLISSLMVGVETVKVLAHTFNKPLIKVNHIEGHLLSISDKLKFPAIGLVVSGGHTQIILAKDYLKYELLGETRDDAAGEAFDKVAKILDLGYPGGPAISKIAEIGNVSDLKLEIDLPRPMLDSKNYDMSFSGLKTAVLYKWQELKETLGKKDLEKSKVLIAREFQQAAIDVLITKTLKAAKEYKAKTVVLGGGVSANKLLRTEFEQTIKKTLPSVELLVPELAMTGDNAAMIAQAAYYHIKKKDFSDPLDLKSDPNWQLV